MSKSLTELFIPDCVQYTDKPVGTWITNGCFGYCPDTQHTRFSQDCSKELVLPFSFQKIPFHS